MNLLEIFIGGVKAGTDAELVDVNRHSATLFYQKIRHMITYELEDESPFCDDIELDKLYFGGRRKDKCGR